MHCGQISDRSVLSTKIEQEKNRENHTRRRCYATLGRAASTKSIEPFEVGAKKRKLRASPVRPAIGENLGMLKKIFCNRSLQIG